jgi:hypothetical protein
MGILLFDQIWQERFGFKDVIMLSLGALIMFIGVLRLLNQKGFNTWDWANRVDNRVMSKWGLITIVTVVTLLVLFQKRY